MTTYREYITEKANNRPKTTVWLLLIIACGFAGITFLGSWFTILIATPIFILMRLGRVVCPRCKTSLNFYFSNGKFIATSPILKEAMEAERTAGLPKNCPKCGLDFDSEMPTGATASK